MNELLLINSVLLWVTVLFNLMLTLALIRRLNSLPQTGMPETLRIGQTAPDFTAETLRGETTVLADYAGRAVAFVFVSAHCSPCKEEMPRLEVLCPQARSAGVELVLVSDTDVTQTLAMVKQFYLTLPVLAAPRLTNDFLTDYKVGGTPFYCWVDAEGKVVATGFLDQAWRQITEQWEANAASSTSQRSAVTLAPSEGG